MNGWTSSLNRCNQSWYSQHQFSARYKFSPLNSNACFHRSRYINRNFLFNKDQQKSSSCLKAVADDYDDVLKNISLEMLKDISRQQGLPVSGTKKQLLERLRKFVDEKIVDEGDFYYTTPEVVNATKDESSTEPDSQLVSSEKPNQPKNMPLASDAYVNENGERVVTIFNTKEESDLTKVGPHTRPGGMDAAAANFADATSNDDVGGLTASDTIRSTEKMEQDVIFSKQTREEIENAKDQCRELIEFLLEGTAPAWSDPSEKIMNTFKPFDPSSIKTDFLSKYSAALRMSRGQLLNEVIREIEIEAVGQDGMAADDTSKGGGHYRQVQRVGTFLKGYRIGESRRIARETASFLLNTVAAEGAQGLDFAFATMARGEGDGELNDDLIGYLEEAVASQKRVVMQHMAIQNADYEKAKDLGEIVDFQDDEITNFDDIDIETININDPKTRETLEHLENEDNKVVSDRELMPTEKLLLLLHSLLERVKAEAAFRADEHGKNLRLMALCINTKNDVQRYNVIKNEIGSSLTRADDFAEFLDSAIQYAESTSTQITPGKQQLDLDKLRKIQREVADIQSIQAMSASGLKSSNQNWGNDLGAFQ